MRHLPLVTLTLLLVTSAETIEGADPYKGYRLPDTQIPSKYEIDLRLSDTVFKGNETSFNGSVLITFQVTENTKEIKLHSCVTIQNVKLLPTNEIILNHTFDTNTEILTIPLTTTLNILTDYALAIQYIGQLDTRKWLGVYRSQYDDVSGTTQYLVTTQFEPTHARKAFPCFDEPKYKATYVLTITYPEELRAISNTPINSDVTKDGYKTTIFTETPLMPTYLVAFTVSGFDCTSGENIDTNVPHQVCSRPETASDRDLAAEYGTKIMNALEEHFDMKYQNMNIGKMDQLAIPDFDGNAMENWGMVTYRESSLLYNMNHTPNLVKQRIIAVIAHEFAHMWFGNLVTLDWWDNTFLNEGFARYFQYFLLTKIPELVGYEMNEQFVIERQQLAFLTDATTGSPSLTYKVATPSEISSKFSYISYNKGASILRMLASLMGSDNFTNSLKQYLSQNTFSTSVPEKLWNVMSNYTPSENLPSNVSFLEVIDNWSNKAGYPLVTVSKNGTDVILTQKRFLFFDTSNTEWYVPISYTLSKDENKFENISANIWLRPNTTHVIFNVLKNNEWIILNNKVSAYYRVNYDTYLWGQIRLVLNSNHTSIDKINRAQIVDDTLNLARSNEIRYSEAFQILDYLRNETCYYPWFSAIEGFDYLLTRLGENSVLGKRVKSRVLNLMTSVKKDLNLANVTGEHIHILKLQKVMDVACKLGDENCIRVSKELFFGDKNGSVSIDKNVRSIVYCNALRYSDDIESDWKYLWNRLSKTSQLDEISNLITALGCTESTKYLRYYLEQSVNASSGIRINYVSELWTSVYSSSTKGLEVAFDFLCENHTQIYAYFTEAWSLLPDIVGRFSTDDQLQKLQTFIDRQPTNSSIRSAAQAALRKARTNFKWVSDKKEDLERLFGISSASGIGIKLYTMLSSIIISMVLFN